MKKVELILASIALLAFGLKLLSVTGGSILTVLSLSALAIIYFVLTFAIADNIKVAYIFNKSSYAQSKFIRILGAIFLGFGLSITLIGILFKVQHWPGANENLNVGLISIAVIGIIALLKYAQKGLLFYKNILLRIGVIGAVGIIALLTN